MGLSIGCASYNSRLSPFEKQGIADRLLVINLQSARLITSHQAITKCNAYLFLDGIHLVGDKH